MFVVERLTIRELPGEDKGVRWGQCRACGLWKDESELFSGYCSCCRHRSLAEITAGVAEQQKMIGSGLHRYLISVAAMMNSGLDYHKERGDV